MPRLVAPLPARKPLRLAVQVTVQPVRPKPEVRVVGMLELLKIGFAARPLADSEGVVTPPGLLILKVLLAMSTLRSTPNVGVGPNATAILLLFCIDPGATEP